MLVSTHVSSAPEAVCQDLTPSPLHTSLFVVRSEYLPVTVPRGMNKHELRPRGPSAQKPPLVHSHILYTYRRRKP